MITYENSINMPTLIYHTVSYHSKFVFDKEQKPKMRMWETGNVLNRILFTRTGAYLCILNGKRQCKITKAGIFMLSNSE